MGINALVTGAKKLAEVDTGAWPANLKDAATSSSKWPNITEQKKALPGAESSQERTTKSPLLTLEGGTGNE